MSERHQLAYALLIVMVAVGGFLIVRWRRGLNQRRYRMRGRKHR